MCEPALDIRMQYDSDAVVAADIAVNPAASGAAKCSRQGGPDFSFESNPVGYDDFHPSRAVSACPAYAVAIDEIIFVAVDIAPRIPKHLAPQSALDKGVLIFRMRRILLDMMTLIPVVLYLASSAYAAAVDEANIAVVCDFYADLCADIALQFCCSGRCEGLPGSSHFCCCCRRLSSS